MLKTPIRHRGKLKPILLSVLVFTMLIVWFLSKLIWFKPLTINLFYERAMIKFALMDPQTMTQIGLLDKYRLDYYNDDLTDPSIETTVKMFNIAKNELKVLSSYKRSKQTESQLMSTDILTWYLEDTSERKTFIYNDFPVNQYIGIQKSMIQFMCNSHNIRNKRDANNYIKRLKKLDNYFERLVSSLMAREEKGIIPPKSSITEVLEEMKTFVRTRPKHNILYTNFKDKLNNLELSQKEKEELLRKAEVAISGEVYDGYNKLIAYYEELLPKSTEYIGVHNIPMGKEYYEFLVKSSTTLNITPEELFTQLEGEVNEFKDQLMELLKNPKSPPRSNINSLEDCQKIVDEMEDFLPQIVTKIPKGEVQIVFSAVNTNGVYQYFPGDINGINPSIISVPRSFVNDSLYNIKWILYHEGVPGHHLQLSIAREMKRVPTFRKVIPFTSYVEGWATYAQHLPWELGLVESDGMEIDIIKNELFHMGRAIIDIGINYKGWSKEEAVEYALKNNITTEGGALGLASFYTIYPTMGLPYAVGCLKIRQLRDYAESQLMESFDIREFHDVVLENGAVPLDILDREVKKYVASKR
jgi:uncharacterized protein (DUF885 family)